MSVATCNTCPYFKPSPATHSFGAGECRIRSNMAFIDLDGNLDRWPQRSEKQWCGEHPDFVINEVAPNASARRAYRAMMREPQGD